MKNSFQKNILVSTIIPVFNEEKTIEECINSLKNQNYRPMEIIVIDDGSTDSTVKILSTLKIKLLTQKHLGPGTARNYGVQKSSGEIIVFVDADMTFDSQFISDLIRPIVQGKTIGTFSKNEMVSNKNNIWAICWNINRNIPSDKMLPDDYPDSAPVFRAILKKEFKKVNGFDTGGEYTDDWSLSRKLGIKSSAVKNAKYYHRNPSNIKEIYYQARWIGKNEFISGNYIRQIKSLILYSLPTSFIVGLFKSVRNSNINFILFKIIYDFAVWISVIRSFSGESKSK